MTGTEGMKGVAVLRNHDWVMERVKMRKREESRLKREKYGSKSSAIWSPSMEQVFFREGVIAPTRGSATAVLRGCH